MLILWDIDGTLLRTTEGIGREMYIRAFRKVLGIDVSECVATMSFAGRTDRSLVHEIGATMGVPAVVVEAAWLEIEQCMIEAAFELIRPETSIALEGAKHTLEMLCDYGVEHALVTGNVEQIGFHKLVMAGFDGFFEHGAFGGHHADRRMLPPIAIERFNSARGTSYAAHDALIVGDAIGDVDCARAHNIMSLAVTTGVQSAEVLRDAGASHVIDSLLPAERSCKLIRTLFRQWIVLPVSPELLDHYSDTRFEVHGLGTLRIGHPLPPAVIDWMLGQGATMVALLGAENPQSTRTTEADNADRHQALAAECHDRCLPAIPAVGLGNDWREHHLLVAGITRDEADDFRRRYDQTTVLHATIDGVVELVGL